MPKYLVKIDDDSYLNIKALKHSIKCMNPLTPVTFKEQEWDPNQPYFMLGSLYPKAKTIVSKTHGHYVRKAGSPSYMYDGKYTPPRLSGSGNNNIGLLFSLVHTVF